MTVLLIILTLLIPPLVPLQAAAQGTGSSSAGPSFDCARARNWDERAICADRDLATLDRRVAEAYQRAVEAAPAERERLQSEQRNWLRERRRCEKPAFGTPQACLRTNMASRTTTLEAGLSTSTGARPPATPGIPPAVASAALRPLDCSRPQGWTAQRICTDPALRRLDESIARHVALVRQRLVAQPVPSREFETALAAHLRQRQDCARPVGRIPEDCLLETLEDADRDWGRLATGSLAPAGTAGTSQQRTPVSPAPAAR